MTQQPFSRPGAIDLSGLGKPAPQPAAPAGHGPDDGHGHGADDGHGHGADDGHGH